MGEIRKSFDVILGSTSDEGKIISGVQIWTREFPFEVNVHYSSADNTPDKLARIAHRLITHGPDVFISGAGLSNILTGAVKTHSQINDLNIGIPISDDSSDGLSALLSTGEKPPYNPVLAVGINNSYAALNIANRFANAVERRELIVLSGSSSSEQAGVERLTKQLGEFGLSYKFLGDASPNRDAVVIAPFDFINSNSREALRCVDKILNAGTGIQVGVSCSPIKESYGDYLNVLDGTYATGLVSSGAISSSMGYVNAALMGAVLTKDGEALEKFKAKRQERVEKLEGHKGLRIKGGEVTKL